ncbi:fragment of putative phosphonate ABC transporter,permease component (phnM) (part 2) [Ralstonia solanacearum K60]|nr:fragment of putative phosphonate ABC transporter,permease component (phnM) (part 2) [Ralstonia solanacearum K60]
MVATIVGGRLRYAAAYLPLIR